MATAVFCIANSEGKAGRIVSDLRAAGFSSDDISALFPDKHGTRDFAHEHSTKAPEGAATGAGLGPPRRLAGLAGRRAPLAIPGIGPFVAAGPIMAAARRSRARRHRRRAHRRADRDGHSRARGQALRGASSSRATS